MLKSKQLMKKNNKREECISKENDEILTDMIIYLRGSDLTEYNQELVRADLIEMVIDAEERGDDSKKVFGGNYKEICDEIIAAFPKKTKVQKVLDMVSDVAMCAWILITIHVVQALILKGITKEGGYMIGVSYGDLINFVLISAGVLVFLQYFSKHVFAGEGKKQMSFIKLWFLVFGVLATLWLISYFVTAVAFKLHIGVLIVLAAIGFLAEKGIAILEER